MLKPAQLYKDEIIKNYIKHWYDLDYQWYFGYGGTQTPNIPDNNFEGHYWASVDEDDNVIGYMCYGVNTSVNSCNNFGIISFDKGNLTFARDIKQAIDDIFYKYKFNRIDFRCFDGNPALRGYRNFIKRYGGREVGMHRKCNRLMDGQLHDCIMFEILREEYMCSKENT